MRFQPLLTLMGMASVMGACAPQAPANVVNGYGGRGTSLSPMTSVSQKITPASVHMVFTPPVLLDPPAATMKEESLASIAPAAGPTPISAVAKPQAKVQTSPLDDPEPTYVEHTVLPSDTAYKLARKYNTSVDRILKDNSLTSMTQIKDGVTLKIAQNSKPQNSAWADMRKMLDEAASPSPVIANSAPQLAPKTEITAELPKAVVDIEPAAGESTKLASKVMPQAAVPVAPKADQFVGHTVEPKETIYRISMKYHVSVLDIMAANDFSEPQDLKADRVIKIPVKTEAALVAKAVDVAPAAGEPVQVAMLTKTDVQSDARQDAETKAVSEQLAVPAKDVKFTADDMKSAEAKRGQVDPIAARSKGLVWPVKGQIVSRFGDDGHGVAKTGINIAVPKGTPVLASESGQVLYADEGLKIYGKLVLIRHDNGMVSAYAHNGYLLVKKNERVKKGQIVALSGASGNVESPQLHFELRQHASAMDPIAMLPRQ